MAIEIREMIIKTTVQQEGAQNIESHNNIDFSKMKNELLKECRKLIKDESSRAKYSR